MRKHSEVNISKKVVHSLKDAVKEESVSVCVPHGGRTEFLYDCLYSLLAQSMRKIQTVLYRKKRRTYRNNYVICWILSNCADANEIVISLCRSSDTKEFNQILSKLRKAFDSQRIPKIHKVWTQCCCFISWPPPEHLPVPLVLTGCNKGRRCPDMPR